MMTFLLNKPLEVPIIFKVKSKLCILASKALCDPAYRYILSLIVASHPPPQLYWTNFSSPKSQGSISNLQDFAHAVPST